MVTAVTIIVIAFVISLTLSLPKSEGVLALDTGLEKTREVAGLPKTEGIATIIGQIIYAILGFLGVIFIILLIYGGFLRMTAQGDPGKIKQSMGIITSAVVGVIIIFASYAITAFVLGKIGASVGEGGGTGTNGSQYKCCLIPYGLVWKCILPEADGTCPSGYDGDTRDCSTIDECR